MPGIDVAELSGKAFVDSIVFPDNGNEITIGYRAFFESNIGYIYLSKSVRTLGDYSLDTGRGMQPPPRLR